MLNNKLMATSSASTQKTLFVVGAGASKEVEMPVSSELKMLIARALNFRNKENDDADIRLAIQSEANRSVPEINLYHQACEHICNAMPQVISIDNFIDQHGNDKRIELCGKLAIVRTILKAESQSHLYVDPSNINNKMKFELLEKTWFASFWKLLTENCNAKDLEQRFSKFAFIIFNYDRCIEHYLYCSLRNIYRMSTTDAAHLVKCIEIYHPYGTVGSLPWQNMDISIEYGDEPNSGQLLELAKQIKTFTEGTDRLSEITPIRSLMLTSPKIIFLGFAFDKLNMKLLLSTHAAQPAAQHIFGTAYEISDNDTDSICNELVETYTQVTPLLKNVECRKLFHEFKRRLSFV